jgi:hypothetical protein
MIPENADVMERSLDQCTVEMFDKPTLPELSDFIWAHDPNVVMEKDTPSIKGKLEVAKYTLSIVQQQTRIAFSLLTCAETRYTNLHHCNLLHQRMKFLQPMM